jgi:hypothetical protein
MVQVSKVYHVNHLQYTVNYRDAPLLTDGGTVVEVDEVEALLGFK